LTQSIIILTLISIVAYTLLSLSLKAAAIRVRSDKVITIAMGVVALLAGIFAFINGEWRGSWLGAAIAVIAGIVFFIAALYRMRALETAPVSLVFAITNLDLVVSGVLTMLIPIFGVQITPGRILAVIVAGAALLVGQRIKGVDRLPVSAFISLGLLSLAGMGYITYAAFFTPLLFFIFWDHLAGFALNIKSLPGINRNEIGWGVLAGVCMFVGFWTLMLALSVDNANIPLILLALSMRTPITALLAVPIFKEKFDLPKLAAIILATLALVFWQAGF
jgi:drug/metabolite transporter (DMT)-like permease